MRLNDTGRIVADEWIKTADIRKAIKLDEWVVMPNHFHGIAVITDDRKGTACRALRKTIPNEKNYEQNQT